MSHLKNAVEALLTAEATGIPLSAEEFSIIEKVIENSAPANDKLKELVAKNTKVRESKVSLATDNTNTPVFSFTQDTYVCTAKLPVDTSYNWQCRDVDRDDPTDGWSEVAGFSTPEGE